jgi:hypothetical protein
VSWRNLRAWDVPQILALLPITVLYMYGALALPEMWLRGTKMVQTSVITLLGVSLVALWIAILSRSETARQHPRKYLVLLIAMLPGILTTGIVSAAQLREGGFSFSSPVLWALPLALFHSFRLGRQIVSVRPTSKRAGQ